ncbi:MAG: hypothetical protein PHF56_16555 [Desulfuromonadaceae bacterium]|nr:hypothetical protein [Desulfuromonadaceae bacterium]
MSHEAALFTALRTTVGRKGVMLDLARKEGRYFPAVNMTGDVLRAPVENARDVPLCPQIPCLIATGFGRFERNGFS